MIKITSNNLTIEDLAEIARSNIEIQLSKSAFKQIQFSHEKLMHFVETIKLLYGINTGYGIFSDKRISLDESKRLNRNLIFSHAVGTGEP